MYRLIYINNLLLTFTDHHFASVCRFPGTCNGWRFEWWLRYMLIPNIPLGSYVLLARQQAFCNMTRFSRVSDLQDNAHFHRKAIVEAMLAAAGMFWIWLPAYSPWWNPVRQRWQWLTHATAHSYAITRSRSRSAG